jgi:hypothetical protein
LSTKAAGLSANSISNTALISPASNSPTRAIVRPGATRSTMAWACSPVTVRERLQGHDHGRFNMALAGGTPAAYKNCNIVEFEPTGLRPR